MSKIKKITIIAKDSSSTSASDIDFVEVNAEDPTMVTVVTDSGIYNILPDELLSYINSR